MADRESRPLADVREWRVARSDLKKASVDDFHFRYSGKIDSLFVFFCEPGRPTLGLVLENNLTALIDPETDELLGFEIDHFVSEMVPAYPCLDPILDLPGMPFQPVRRVKQLISRNDPRRALGLLMEQVWPALDAANGQMKSAYR